MPPTAITSTKAAIPPAAATGGQAKKRVSVSHRTSSMKTKNGAMSRMTAHTVAVVWKRKAPMPPATMATIIAVMSPAASRLGCRRWSRTSAQAATSMKMLVMALSGSASKASLVRSQ